MSRRRAHTSWLARYSHLDDGIVAKHGRDIEQLLPVRAFTVAAWVSIDQPQRWGGLFGCVSDDGDHEKGFVLGYDETTFTIGNALSL